MDKVILEYLVEFSKLGKYGSEGRWNIRIFRSQYLGYEVFRKNSSGGFQSGKEITGDSLELFERKRTRGHHIAPEDKIILRHEGKVFRV